MNIFGRPCPKAFFRPLPRTQRSQLSTCLLIPFLLFFFPFSFVLYSRKCGNNHGLIRKYHMMLCRRCFRENAVAIGFRKVS